MALAALVASVAVARPPAALARRTPPELVFEAPAVLAPQVERLESAGGEALLPAMDLLGLEDPGGSIRVVLAPEGSAEARRAPSWAVAYALGGASLVVLIPSRVPGYPDDSMETVLRHEVAHVLIARAARHRRLPRWFDEGLAIRAAREWRFEDRARLMVATVKRDGVALAELERRFAGGSHSASSAYALSAAFVRFLFDRHGPFVAARIFDHMAANRSFEEAFRRATGSALALEERRFWRHLDIWSKWVPLLSSSATLWMLITGLALLAFKRRRDRDAEQLEAWEEEEERRQSERMPIDDWVH